MRLLPVAIAALIAVSSVSTPSTAKAEDLLAASICDYVKSNDKNRLRKKLKENRVKLRNIYSGLSCDGESLLRTAYHSNAEDTGEFIAKRLSKTELEVVEADGKTIVDWADANGFGASIITLAIQDRLGS
ncbi:MULTISPECIES: DUF3718 domain-containing protein [Shewanella]|uniref:Uncharacterized protein DUF3718 n=1 Tax=Shewanella chilikensis TaxID=558541 RepID=A0ABX5PNB2_9GAMM|nr:MULTISPECIES: DUF3718 domain-containing protein [Shewanella]MBZ4678685.1 hypothetical protein [Shewanella sp.]MCA0949090.1 DUF3718 domain-containing protein [Shewanella chilikensis]MCE9852150.1 DUF3718 domain-containing protein [Shewanella chilikensis]MCL1154638.1 DUF3718 domain-containing protein [Shewanella chilikensis]PYE58377.1 uncharacterized protein DUF3718 [Shewanella chilikensis]